MSQENVEAVGAAFAAFLDGGIDAVADRFAEDAVIVQPPNQADFREYVGRDGLIQATEEWVGQWDDWQMELRHLEDADPYVLAHMYQRGRGKVSGVEVGTELISIFTIENDKVSRWEMFFSEADAREALRLKG